MLDKVSNSETIDVNNEAELNWWADFFGINKDKLKDAIKMVGTSIKSIRRYLQK
jgi:hypothetical protein